MVSLSIAKEWRIRIAEVDSDDELGEGLMAIDPSTPWESLPATATHAKERCFALGLFVRAMRRRLGLNVEMLAREADVEVADLLGIEREPRHVPELRTVFQLAGFFDVSSSKLLQVAGLIGPMDARLFNAAVRFVEGSANRATRNYRGDTALGAFVVALCDEF
ncbi:MAG: helix-turn-helix transcriptional regulator [Bryobacterales bacterium]|nr:helix-turn-helix transcriptional regulator [Bryobacterales bacterium]